MERALSVTLLGAVQASYDGEVIDLGTAKQRAVFVLLTLRVGEIVPSEALAEVLWRDRQPRNAVSLLHTYVARLRRLLEPDAPRHARNHVIASASGGYRLSLPAHRIDLMRFRRLTEAADELLRRGRPAPAFELLTAAVSMWSDPDLTGLRRLLPGGDPVDTLRREWVNACLQLVTVALDLDRPVDALRVAERLAAAEPLHEAVQARYVIALARSGRRARAVERYAQIRERLTAELGIEPGPELIACARDLRDDAPAYTLPDAVPATAKPPCSPVTDDVPDTDTLIGRGADLAAVTRMLAGNRVVTIAGPAGCGKSALAAAVRQRAETVHVDMSRVPTPAEAKARIHRLLTVPGVALRPLLLLDNVDHLTDTCAALVDDLVRADHFQAVLVTSREPLGLAYETVWRMHPLPSAPADPRNPPPAVRLFAHRAAQAEPGFRVDERNLPVVSAICARLDGLPLAIEHAAGRVTDETPDEMLRSLDRPAPAYRAVIFAALQRSLDSLTPAERWCFTRLSELPRQFRLGDAHRVCDSAPWWRTGTQAILDGLVHKSLLTVRHEGNVPAYAMLSSVHQFAATLGAGAVS